MFRFGPMHEKLSEIHTKPYLGKMQPFRVIGNVYFVGTYQASCHLIDTGAGLIMIDPGYASTAYLVIDSIYQLGFSPRDIQYIINFIMLIISVLIGRDIGTVDVQHIVGIT